MIRNYSNTAQQSTLTSAVGATDTTLVLNSYIGEPTPPFTAAIARGTATEEVVLVTAASGTTVTVTRGYDGTSAQAQGAGAAFQEVVAALDFREANTHVNATSGVHGLAGALVGLTDVQTLTNKTLTSATLTNPTITGTATVATANVTTLTVSGATSLANLTATGTVSLAATTVASLTVSGALTANGGITATTVTASGTLAANGGLTTSTATATGLVKGAGVETTAGLTLAQMAAPAGSAGKESVWAQTDGGLYLRSGTGTVARARVHWGSATSFPAAQAGDTVLRTDLGNTLWTYDGANWLTQNGAVEGKMWRTAGFSASLSSGTVKVAFDTSRLRGGFTFDDTNDRLTLPVDGFYEVSLNTYFSGGTGSADCYVVRTRASVTDVNVTRVYAYKPDSTADSFTGATEEVPLKAGDLLFCNASVLSTAGAFTYYGGAEANGFSVRAKWIAPLNGATPI